MIQGVHQVSIGVTDVDRAIEFWTSKIGCAVAKDSSFGEGERWVELVTPDGMLLALSTFTPIGKPVREGMPTSNVFFYCDDLEATHAELSAKGVEFPNPPVELSFGWWSSFRDSEGNEFSLTHKE